jgi:hypothetical protein
MGAADTRNRYFLRSQRLCFRLWHDQDLSPTQYNVVRILRRAPEALACVLLKRLARGRGALCCPEPACFMRFLFCATLILPAPVQGRRIVCRGAGCGSHQLNAGEPSSIGSDLKVEAMLPAGTLQRYQVVMDYQKRTLTFAQPRTVQPEGIRIPLHINRRTGLIAVDASIDDRSYAVTRSMEQSAEFFGSEEENSRQWVRASGSAFFCSV